MNTQLRRFFAVLYIIVIFSASALYPGTPDEGMYPLSEIRKLDLRKAGLKIPVSDIYNTEKPSLIDALVRVGGCTGSFVSDKGLILTNHHCAFDYVRQASTVENNYLENGFYADSYEKEIPAQGLTCMITESYEDVSAEVISAADKASSMQERVSLIQKKTREIIVREEKSNPGIKAEVSEMFTGKSYILFRYRVLKDVRLAFVPPRSIGDFGGDSDNWVWPRHTGDFSYLRAYTGKDGSPAEYSKDNIPYSPKKFLRVNPAGVDENDFVFILGYPGRTFRHQPAKYVEYQEKIQLPYIQKLYADWISIYESLGEKDPGLKLLLSSRIKTLANTEKNYRGKLQGLGRLSLVDKKKSEEKTLREFINSESGTAGKYGSLFSELDKAYNDLFSLGRAPFAMAQLRRQLPGRLAVQLAEYKSETAKSEKDRKPAYQPKNIEQTVSAMLEDLRETDIRVDVPVLARLLNEAAQMPGLKELAPFARFAGSIEETGRKVAEMLNGSIVYDSAAFAKALSSASDESWKNDRFLAFLREASDAWQPVEKKNDEISGSLNVLLPKLTDIKSSWRNTTFIPDANSTLRLTYGYIRGYSPSDATYFRPVTTLTGAVEKSAQGGVYSLHPKVRELYDKKDFGKFMHKKLKDLPCAILYNMDTTGGNSGSPVMDENGNLVGVNFDRAYEATVNDYAWSADYSRSIAVDIRFVLWVTQKVGGAQSLLDEMGVK